jgi:hypothetical protein
MLLDLRKGAADAARPFNQSYYDLGRADAIAGRPYQAPPDDVYAYSSGRVAGNAELVRRKHRQVILCPRRKKRNRFRELLGVFLLRLHHHCAR